MMIQAEHKKWAGWLFDPYLNGIFRKDYQAFYLTNPMPEIPEDRGLLVTPNHISWWDGFFIYYLTGKLFDRKMYLMMLKEQLARFAFFRFLGAYSIDPGLRKAVFESIEYTAQCLDLPGSFVVIYPQGEIVPQRSAPVELQKGMLAALARAKRPADVLPVIFLVKPFNERHPEIWCRFGSPIPKEKVKADFPGYEAQMNKEIETLEQSVLRREWTGNLFDDEYSKRFRRRRR